MYWTYKKGFYRFVFCMPKSPLSVSHTKANFTDIWFLCAKVPPISFPHNLFTVPLPWEGQSLHEDIVFGKPCMGQRPSQIYNDTVLWTTSTTLQWIPGSNTKTIQVSIYNGFPVLIQKLSHKRQNTTLWIKYTFSLKIQIATFTYFLITVIRCNLKKNFTDLEKPLRVHFEYHNIPSRTNCYPLFAGWSCPCNYVKFQYQLVPLDIMTPNYQLQRYPLT